VSLTCFVRAQNLVPNGDFELYSTCPTDLDINKSIGWYNSVLSPDYYNSCAGSVPSTGLGYQQDCCGGNGFVGLFGITGDGMGQPVDREFIGIQLTDTLMAGHKYIAHMYVNKSNSFDYAIASLGMLFTDTAIILPSSQGYFTAVPQVINTMVVTDTANWVLIEDTLLAQGNERFLTIGNFNTTAQSDTINVGGNGPTGINSYYFIDHVEVYDISVTAGETIKTPPTIKIFPNPVMNSGSLSISTQEKISSVKIYSATGSQIEIQIISSTETSTIVNLLKAVNGLYSVLITLTDGQSFFYKVVVD
jgi:hypothetical protein